MNHQNAFSTPFRDRNLASFAKPTRFSSEPEGEGMEIFLRVFLVACLIAATIISAARVDHAVKDQPAPMVDTSLAASGSVAAPAARTL